MVGNLFDSQDSIGHCVSVDFKMSAGIAKKNRHNCPGAYPTNIDHTSTPLWPQHLPDSKRLVFHLINKKNSSKPTCCTPRASLKQMRAHADQNNVPRINLPCVRSGLDKLEWSKVQKLIQETFCTFAVQIIVFLEPTVNPEDNKFESLTDSNVLVKAQRADEALQHVRKWVREGHHVPMNNELQGLPRLCWQLHNQFPSLGFNDNVLCQKFEPLNGSLSFLQQIIPRSLVPD